MDGADMTDSEPASGAPTPELSSVTRVTVEEKNTVGAMVPGMPYVAATPYLVGMAEMACSRLVKDLLEPGQVTVGSRVVIDHLGPSKVGAELVIKATGSRSVIENVPHADVYGDHFEDVGRRIPDITNAREILGWTPRVGLAEGVDRTVSWWREQER